MPVRLHELAVRIGFSIRLDLIDLRANGCVVLGSKLSFIRYGRLGVRSECRKVRNIQILIMSAHGFLSLSLIVTVRWPGWDIFYNGLGVAGITHHMKL